MECAVPLGVPVVADPTTAGAVQVISASIHPTRGLRVTVQQVTCR